jgi:predicted nucleotidyltransferase
MFTIEERQRVRDRVLELARGDDRVAAAAVVGSFAEGRADRWSDLDLTFGVEDGTTPQVLADWTASLERDLGAVRLFDLPSGPSIYRVLLFPGALQVDLSFTPAAWFGPRGGAFELLFGSIGEPGEGQGPAFPASDAERQGLVVHHLVRTRICVERGRSWQAAYWLGEARDEIVVLACARRGLPTSYGRGVDLLPDGARRSLEATLVRTTERAELLRALDATVELLASEGGPATDADGRLLAELRSLAGPIEPAGSVAG